MKVNIIIGGYQKCGTTALHSFLSAHPKVIGSNPKELDFFNYEENYKRGVKYYHSKFSPQPFFAQLRGFKYLESSPSYINDENILRTTQRIKKYNKNIKIILLVRNPIDRAYSAWNMYKKRFESGNTNWWFEWMESRKGVQSNAIRRTKEEYKNFTLFIKREFELVSDKKQVESPILKNGNYTNGLKIYREVFDKNLLVIKNETLNSNTLSTMNNISDFLNLSKFDWSRFKSQKIFEGNYEKPISEEAKHLLNNYYKDEINELFQLTGISYHNKI